MIDAVYLDHNATTALRPSAAIAMAETMELVGNPSSVHRFGRVARRRLEDARESVARMAGAEPSRVVFTSGGTESNNLALRGCARQRILVSAVEHASVLRAADDVEVLPVDDDGIVDLDALTQALAADERPAIVSVMLANNETGVVQPVAPVAERARAHGALVHCDAVQAAGKIALDIGGLGVDLLSLSAHKIGGPSGVGALVVRDDVVLTALNRGGGQERGYRGGTENLPGIAGFAAAANDAVNGLSDVSVLAEFRDTLEQRLLAASPAMVFGRAKTRLPNTSCLSMPGVDAETQVMNFDLAGIAVSAGSACSSGKVESSHVLAAMDVAEDVAANAIRVSFGWSSVPSDGEKFAEAWMKLYRRLGTPEQQARTG